MSGDLYLVGVYRHPFESVYTNISFLSCSCSLSLPLPFTKAVLVLWVLFAQNSPNVLAYLMGIRFVKEGTTERAGGCSMLVYFVLSVPLGITMMPCCACFGKKQLLVEHCLKVQLVKKDMNIA